MAVEEVGQVEVEGFVITGDGDITVGSIAAEVQVNPVDVRITATFETNRFIGTIDGTFTPTLGVRGALDIGSNGTAADPWTHVYATLVLKTPGIPLGTTGLKVTQLGGGFGFNFNAQDLQPERGTYGVGLTLGIADLSNLFEIVGSAYVQFGPNVLILLEGELSVPASQPVVRGLLEVAYALPQAHVSGSVTTTIQVPSGSGSIIDIDQQRIDFDFRQDFWWIEGGDLEGEILRALQLSEGVIHFHRRGNRFEGELGGRADFSVSGSVEIVEIDDCSSYWDAGLELNYSASVHGQFDVSFSNHNVSGFFLVGAEGSAGATYKLPLLSSCGKLGVSVEGELLVGLLGQVCASGSLTYHPSIRGFPNTFSTGAICI